MSGFSDRSAVPGLLLIWASNEGYHFNWGTSRFEKRILGRQNGCEQSYRSEKPNAHFRDVRYITWISETIGLLENRPWEP